MIELTRLNGNRMAVNSELILFADAAPDTVLTMVTGEKLIVTENLAEIADRMASYRAQTMAKAARLCPGSGAQVSGAALSVLSSGKAVNAVAGKGEIDKESAGAMRRRRRAEA